MRKLSFESFSGFGCQFGYMPTRLGTTTVGRPITFDIDEEDDDNGKDEPDFSGIIQDLTNRKNDIIQFIKYLLKCNNHQCKLDDFLDNTKIEISTELKENKYTKYYEDYVRKEIKNIKMGICNENCPLKQSSIFNELDETELIELDEPMERLQGIIDSCDCRRCKVGCDRCGTCKKGGKCREKPKCCCKRLKKLLKNFSSQIHSKHFAGGYDFGNNIITMYISIIDPSVKEFYSVFAHEVFHAYHMKSVELAGGKWLKKNNYNCDLILESLADSFTYYYDRMVLHEPLLADQEYRAWANTKIDYNPYSGAKGIVDIGNVLICVNKQKDDEFPVSVHCGATKLSNPFRKIFRYSLERTEKKSSQAIIGAWRLTDNC